MNELKNYTAEQLAEIPLNDLHVIQDNITKAISLRKDLDKKEWMDKLQQLIEESGFKLDELVSDIKLSSTAKDKKTGKAQPKYRNPDNHEETWAGKGPRKKWLIDALAAGRTLDEFEIK